MLDLRHLLAALLLVTATAIAILPQVRYRHVVPELADADGGLAWSTSACGVTTNAAGVVTLRADSSCRQPWAAVRFPAPSGWTAVSVGADVTAHKLQFGPEGWQRPLVGVEAIGAADSVLSRAVVVIPVAAGEASLESWSRVFRIPAASAIVRIRFGLAAIAGTLNVAAVELRGIEGRAWYPRLRAGLAAAWLAWFTITAIAWLRCCQRRWAGVLTIAVVVLIAVGTVLSRGAIVVLADAMSAPFEAAADPPNATATDDAGPPADTADARLTTHRAAMMLAHEWRAGRIANAGHVAGFLLLAACLVLSRPRGGLRVIGPTLLVIAATTELLQGLTVSRTPRLSDIGLDLAGAAVGLGLGLALGRRRRHTSGMSVPKT